MYREESSDLKPVKQSDDGNKLYARLSGPKGQIFSYLLAASGSGLDIKLSNHEARKLGLQEAGEEQHLPHSGGAKPLIVVRRSEKPA